MKRFNINLKLIEYILETNCIYIYTTLYNKAESAVYFDGIIDWRIVHNNVRQGCLFSPTLFNILLEQIMNDALDNHVGSVNIGGKII